MVPRPMRYSNFIKQASFLKIRLTALATQISVYPLPPSDEGLSEADIAKIKVIDETAIKKNAEFESFIGKLFSAEPSSEDIKDEEVIKVQEEISDLYIKIHSTCIALLPTVEPTLNQSQSSTHATVSTEQLSGIRLPPLNLSTFSGQPDKWIGFHSLFESIVHKNSNISDIEKFTYLLSCLSGEPLNLVKTLPLTPANYHVAFRLLAKRYNNSRLLITLHINNILDMPSVHNCSVKQLRSFISVLQENVSALLALNHDISTESLFITNYLLRKFDNDFRSKFEHSRADSQVIPTLTELIAFIEKECSHLEAASLSIVTNKTLPITQTLKTHATLHSKHSRATSAPRAVLLTAQNSQSCTFCSAPDHIIYRCGAFSNLATNERLKFIQNNSLCNNCLGHHNVRNCKSQRSCNVCQRRHHTMLHLRNISNQQPSTTSNSIRPRSVADSKADVAMPSHSKLQFRPESSDSPQTSPATTAMVGISHARDISILLATTLVKLSANGCSVVVRAVLDSAAQHSFITQDCAYRLNIMQPHNECSQILGISSSSVNTKGMIKVTIASLSGQILSEKHPVIILEKITNNLPCYPVSRRVRDQMRHLMLADPTFDTPAPVDALIGADLFPHVLLGDSISLGENMPTALNTIFGYVLMGTSPVLYRTMKPNSVNLLTISNFDLHNAIQRFWSVENPPNKSMLSPEEEDCEIHFQKTHCRLEDGRYQVRLPLKENPAVLGDSSNSALKMFKFLEKRLSCNQDLKEKYIEFMRDYRESGHMVPHSDPTSHEQPFYFLPHHGVLRDNKIRVVFNASAATSSGISLNHILHVGQKLHNDIPNIIFHFRRHSIVFCTDARQMFRNIWLHPEDQRLQLIYWRENPEDTLQVFRLTTVTYGMASSPFLANRVIMQLINDEGHHHPLAAAALKEGLYVDDAILGCDSVEEALRLQEDVIQLMKKGGFSLRKWSSNHRAVLEAVPQDYCITPLQFHSSEQPLYSILGLKWLPEADGFSYVVRTDKSLHTKRSVLSSIAQIYDPMGWISPVVFWAKAFMQILWTKGLEWDDTLPSDLSLQWETFIKELTMLEKIFIPRLVDTSSATEIQLHGFCDASEAGFCASVFVRICTTENHIKVALLIAKSRVAPLKRVSLPRLELCGAHMLSKLLEYCTSQLSTYLSINQIFGWCDSTITLSWIQTPAYRLKTYVANRVAEIQDISSPVSWSHIASSSNPADCGSRGLFPSLMVSHPLWWNGPPWLSSPQSSWPNISFSATQRDSLPEIKPSMSTVLHSTDTVPVDFLTKFSSWNKLIYVTAYILRFIRNCRAKINCTCSREEISNQGDLAPQSIHISILEKDCATLRILKLVQEEVFIYDIKALRKKCAPSSKLTRLTPFLDDNDLIRVGGRLQNSALNYNAKHPILLPKNHFITNLIIDYYHEIYLHCGPHQLQSLLSQKYWILSARSAIRSRIFKCIRCYRCKPRIHCSQMANLPEVRVTPTRAFSTSAADFAGPFNVKVHSLRRLQHVKIYLCLFICMATKAIHLEVVMDLTTGAFIACLTRFISRRGLLQHLYSDNATNFVGAERKLRETIQHLLKQDTAQQFLLKNGISFHFIPPRAPHFGGLWERAIQSAKNHMRRVIGEQVLTIEEFTTLACKVESMLNSRPLTPLSSDPREYDVLTPGHFLTGGPLVTLPELDHTNIPANCLKRWELVQAFAQHIWKRWHSEYLHTLQCRPKWTQPRKNLEPGDFVLIHDENTPPLQWKMGRISKVIPGKDGIVRVAEINTATGHLKRPVVKLAPLPLD